MYSPMDFVFKSIHTFWYIINPILVVADGFARGFSLISAVDYLRFSAHSDLQTSYVALVLGGTFASCGGGLIADFFGLNRIEWGVHTPRFVQNVPYGVKASFFLALGYVISISPELPIHRQLISLISQLSPYLLPGIGLDSEESTVDISLIHFVFRSLFVLFLLFDEFGNAPLVAFEAPGSDVPDQEPDREISDLSVIPKEEPVSEHNFLSPQTRYLNSATRPSSVPISKASVTPRSPLETPYTQEPLNITLQANLLDLLEIE
ncbi:hypothetical protein DSO57_1034562 [Entomophthora muscae]|uniref:Uncharacterized protein n=1 Tax=Entomophthora muscae TaxID=34485 RepID=A0ACC2UK41_9FUNG|nr:hypothetical protein DSO57_1034562 [Entomophthora muscae]